MLRFRDSIYFCDDLGNIFNGNTGRILKQKTCKSGYKQVCLYMPTGKKSFYVHRIVGECFIDNPDLKPEINHIDGDKGNNRSENLEWVTSSENQQHAFSSGLQSPSRLFGEMNGTYRGVIYGERIMDGERLQIRALTDCKDLGFTQSSVHKVINGKLKTHKGYRFWREE